MRLGLPETWADEDMTDVESLVEELSRTVDAEPLQSLSGSGRRMGLMINPQVTIHHEVRLGILHSPRFFSSMHVVHEMGAKGTSKEHRKRSPDDCE